MRNALVFLFLTACSTDPAGPGPAPDAGTTHTDTCQGTACGLPGQDPCGCGDTCVNFGDFGSSICAADCHVDADCPGGACVDLQSGAGRVCGPKEWGGVAGILPEEMCRLASSCDFVNESQCNTFFAGADGNSGCLGNLTQGELSQWVSAIEACSTSSCSTYEACLRTLPYCTFQ
jgi:hypothetical protein